MREEIRGGGKCKRRKKPNVFLFVTFYQAGRKKEEMKEKGVWVCSILSPTSVMLLSPRTHVSLSTATHVHIEKRSSAA